ncbi:GspH/FimT family pseudopilin (plasmid) [Legionella sp. D16C41]|uniref:GspH/FimT family pseudopilin n=1 Tax=Legionella sp. D16C41 TaxID=3402688 RepID=UPI003AF64338
MHNFYLSASLNKGFSLTELLITLALAAIILVFAVPGLQTLVLNARRNAMLDGIYNALNFTRLTALSQNANVTICPYSAPNSTSCGSNWSAGWIVITQPTTGSPTLLQSHRTTPNSPTLSSNIQTILFNAQGLASSQANFKVCDTRGARYAGSVVVLLTGFIQIGATPGQAVWDNSQLVCP